MRIHFRLTPNTEVVPFNYQAALVGAFHRWLGENELHDDISLYSLSWLDRGKARKDGLHFPEGSHFFVSAPDERLLKELIQGVFEGQQIRWGMEVYSIELQNAPDFGAYRRFWAQSPVLIKRPRKEGKHAQFYFPGDPESNDLLTETLRHKMDRAGLSVDVQVRFDPEFRSVSTKKISYKGIDIKGAYCPVIVEGDPRAVQFAWEVGVGNSTGIGFGALV